MSKWKNSLLIQSVRVTYTWRWISEVEFVSKPLRTARYTHFDFFGVERSWYPIFWKIFRSVHFMRMLSIFFDFFHQNRMLKLLPNMIKRFFAIFFVTADIELGPLRIIIFNNKVSSQRPIFQIFCGPLLDFFAGWRFRRENLQFLVPTGDFCFKRKGR